MQLNRKKLWVLVGIYEYLPPKDQMSLHRVVSEYFSEDESFYVGDLKTWCNDKFYHWLLEVDFNDVMAPYLAENIGIVTIDDEAYPERLRQIYQPPLALFYQGDITLLKTLSLGMVGSRQHTNYGEICCRKVMAGLKTHKEVTIVSGLARGIDSISHTMALKYGLQTIGVIGTGLNVIYPKENGELQRLIAKNGLLISEYPLNSRPLKFHFPYRNRIIAGLSHGVCVIEAKMKSGSLITANIALQENRQVMAIPGNITSIFSEGTNQLIKAGAICVTEAEDILENCLFFE